MRIKDPLHSIYSYFLIHDVKLSKDNYISYPSKTYPPRDIRALHFDNDVEIFIKEHNNSKILKNDI